jgi:hypothetical protein
MIRRSTLVYLVLLLVLAGAYYYLNNREQPAETEATAEPAVEVSYLFNAEEGTPTSIRVESRSGETVEVARGADNAWVLNQPVEAKAEQGAAEAAASQLTTVRILDRPPDVDPKIVGLENPEYVLTITFTGGAERTVDVGVLTPTQTGYYIRADDDDLAIASRSAIDALLGLLVNPPYLETQTPSPVPATETSTPLPTTPEADSPPSETATPQP